MSNTKEEIQLMVADILEMEPDEVLLDKPLKELLQVDSMVILEVLVAIERRFGVKINEAEAKVVKTLMDMVKLVDQKINPTGT